MFSDINSRVYESLLYMHTNCPPEIGIPPDRMRVLLASLQRPRVTATVPLTTGLTDRSHWSSFHRSTISHKDTPAVVPHIHTKDTNTRPRLKGEESGSLQAGMGVGGVLAGVVVLIKKRATHMTVQLPEL